MDGKFIYVFSENDKDALVAMGYSMLHCCAPGSIYVFLNKERLDFAEDPVLKKIAYAITDTLTFS